MSVRTSNTFRWRGAQSTSWADGRNWVDANNTAYAQAQYPGYDGTNTANVDGDIVLLDAVPTNALAGYTVTTKGLLASFRVTSAYNTTIGTSTASPLILSLQNSGTAVIDGTGAGNIFLKGGGNGISNVSIEGTKSGSTLTLDGAIGACTLFAGTITIASTAVISNLLTVGCLQTPMTDVTLTINSGAALPATIITTGGRVTCNAVVQSLLHMNGSWTQAADANDINHGGGTIVWNAGDIGTLTINAGTVDASQNKTTSRSIGQATINRQGTLNLSGTGDSVSCGPIQMNGGTIGYPTGQAITMNNNKWPIASSRFRGTTWQIFE